MVPEKPQARFRQGGYQSQEGFALIPSPAHTHGRGVRRRSGHGLAACCSLLIGGDYPADPDPLSNGASGCNRAPWRKFQRPPPSAASAPVYATMPRIRPTWRSQGLFCGHPRPQATRFLPHDPDRSAGDRRTGDRKAPRAALTLRAWAFPCPGVPEGIKRQHAVYEL
jgi:hypothetical protein